MITKCVYKFRNNTICISVQSQICLFLTHFCNKYSIEHWQVYVCIGIFEVVIEWFLSLRYGIVLITGYTLAISNFTGSSRRKNGHSVLL